ncbi:hypothetical protein FKM82_013699 [Ascaphus truei]
MKYSRFLNHHMDSNVIMERSWKFNGLHFQFMMTPSSTFQISSFVRNGFCVGSEVHIDYHPFTSVPLCHTTWSFVNFLCGVYN